MSTYIPSNIKSELLEYGNQNIGHQANYQVNSVIRDQYHVKEILTGGTLAKTFHCYDQSSGNEVVLKSIDARLFTDPEKENRFLEEIENWMKLPRCPNIVNIVGVFYDDIHTQSLFLVIPYYSGHPEHGIELKDWFKNYKFSELDIFYTALCICKAFKDCAEKLGSVPVHGDIKPSNILLEFIGNRFTNQPLLSCNIRLADCGAIGYTPAYFPQDYQNKGLPPDEATDVYALFTVLREMEDHAEPSYSLQCPMHGLIELMLSHEQWRIYDLTTVYDDFLLMILEHQYGIEPDYLLYKPLEDRATEIFYRVQNIHTQSQLVHKNESGLQEIKKLRAEAEKQHYNINGIPLTHYIDRHYYVCASLSGEYTLCEEILSRFEKDQLELAQGQKGNWGAIYSNLLSDEMRILHAHNLEKLGQLQVAISMYHDVDFEQCICFTWLGSYIEMLFPVEPKVLKETQFLADKLSVFLLKHAEGLSHSTLTYLHCCLGILLGYLGECDLGCKLLKRCVSDYPDNLEYLYQYGFALMLNGDIYMARYPLHMLYYHCCKIENRSKSYSGYWAYPAQSISFYKLSAALMLGAFPDALKALRDYNQSQRFYEGKQSDKNGTIEDAIYSSYEYYNSFSVAISQLTIEGVFSSFLKQYEYWRNLLSDPIKRIAFIYQRGELQVFMNLHTMCCDFATALKEWDYLIELCNKMLSIRKESSNILKYLGRAYAMKGQPDMAMQFYKNAADLIPFEYPRYPANGEDSTQAQIAKEDLRKEMQMLGLDSTLIV